MICRLESFLAREGIYNKEGRRMGPPMAAWAIKAVVIRGISGLIVRSQRSTQRTRDGPHSSSVLNPLASLHEADFHPLI